MKGKGGWLWDRKFSVSEAKSILDKPQNRHFLSLASLLFARNNDAKEVFGSFIKPIVFLNNWSKIKRQMRKDDWNNPRIEFWQAIYERLREKYKAEGKFSANKPALERGRDEFCKIVGDKIKNLRKQKGFTQIDFAKNLGVSQQMISRIESGRENLSLLTIKKIAEKLDTQLNLDFS